MNKHIELVKKWLADKDSVSQEELEDNSAAAYTDVNEAAYAAYRAASSASAGYAGYAGHWVKRYEELTK